MLEARNITFAYDSSSPVLRNLSLSVSPGERVVIDALSGRGKTTLCKLLAGYLRPDEGEVLVDGAKLPEKGVCPVQLILQHPELAVDPRMRMEDVLLESGRPLSDLNEKFGIKDKWMRRYPHELSGGELQRFCIVRALMANPRYIIADEISTMLDAVTQAQIWDALISEAGSRGMGMVLVTHSEALADRIATRSVKI